MKKLLLTLFSLAAFVLIPSNTFAANDFTAEYFNNINLSGSPVLTRTETQINNNWGSGSPDSSVPVNYFSARWTGTFNFEAGRYVFSSTTDDGARLKIDGQTIIDKWIDQGETRHVGIIDLTAGDHVVTLEYYDREWDAIAKLSWEKQVADTTQGTKLMPLGDSITDGWDIPGGYRIDLKNLVSSINFVGSVQNGPAQLTDREHEGHPGWRIDEIQGQITPWMQTYSPEMILLMIGTNDVLQNHDLGNAPQRLSNLIDSITQLNPNTKVLVASITPLNNNDWQQKANTYNATIPGIVQQKRDQGKKVYYVDMHTALTYSDLPDSIHPNASGYSKMAQKWASAIAAANTGSNPTNPTPTPTQTPTPTPVQNFPIPTDNGFRGQYFNNMTLTGNPVFQRNETQVNYNWGEGKPHTSVNQDFFSTKWDGNFTFSQGTYRFTVRADDGIRLKINDQIKIDKWIDQGPTTYTTDVTLSGVNKVTMEYYERQWGAVAELSWVKLGATPTPTNTPTPTSTPTPETPTSGYQAQYFNNISLSGSPVLTRNETAVQNDWGSGSPHASVNSDNFSARWTTVEPFAASTYRFTVRADDGVRLKVDGTTVIDKWIDQAPTTYTIDLNMTAGDHTIVMEYYEKGWGAVAQLGIAAINAPTPPPVVEGSFQINYYNNITMTGVPVHTQNSATISTDWGMGSPHSSVNNNYFSVKANKTKNYTAGTYRFSVTADDGVRLKVDGITRIDKWIDQGATTYTYEMPLSAGEHTVTVEYYEKEWDAILRFSEAKL